MSWQTLPVGHVAAISGEARSRHVAVDQPQQDAWSPRLLLRSAPDRRPAIQTKPRSRTGTHGPTVIVKTPGGKPLEIRRVRIKRAGRTRGDAPGAGDRVTFRDLKQKLPRDKNEPKKVYKQRLGDALAERVRKGPS